MGEEAELGEDFETWKIELETALFEEAEIGTLRNIARGRPVPENLRVDFWKVRRRLSTLRLTKKEKPTACRRPVVIRHFFSIFPPGVPLAVPAKQSRARRRLYGFV